MRKIKYIIPMILLFMVIGFATVSISLSINADMEMLGDLDDFSVYYSKVLVNGEEDPTVVVSATELDFTTILDKVGTTYTITYDITNASASFDADISISCTGSTEYFSVVNDFDTTTPVPAKGTRTGTLSVSKIKTIAGDEQSNNVSCEVVATPVEIEEEGTGEVPIPLEKYDPYKIGTEISIGDEKFNVISTTEDTVTMLAQYNLGSDYKQTTTWNSLSFSDSGGWDYDDSVIDLFYQSYDGNAKTYINNYVSYIKNKVSDNNVSGDLISLAELKLLGCDVSTDYSYTSDGNCSIPKYASWLVNGQDWWTRSAVSYEFDYLWFVYDIGLVSKDLYTGTYGIRPTITLPKDVFESEVITFTIEGKEYTALRGMTWREWMTSDYNTDLQLYIVDWDGKDRISFSTTYDDMFSWLYYSSEPQNADYFIISGYPYTKGADD